MSNTARSDFELCVIRPLSKRPRVDYSEWPEEFLRVRMDELTHALQHARALEVDPVLISELEKRLHEIHYELNPLTAYQEYLTASDSDEEQRGLRELECISPPTSIDSPR